MICHNAIALYPGPDFLRYQSHLYEATPNPHSQYSDLTTSPRVTVTPNGSGNEADTKPSTEASRAPTTASQNTTLNISGGKL